MTATDLSFASLVQVGHLGLTDRTETLVEEFAGAGRVPRSDETRCPAQVRLYRLGILSTSQSSVLTTATAPAN
ncbi:MAG: hypothetical protein V5A55_14160, partial [Halovenus sp.]